jgi:hypothetical protein
MGALRRLIARTVKVAGLGLPRVTIWVCSFTFAGSGADGVARETYGFFEVLRREIGELSSDERH